MVDIILLLMAIASAISLLVVSPRDLQRKAILALREYEEMELSHAHANHNALSHRLRQQQRELQGPQHAGMQVVTDSKRAQDARVEAFGVIL
jgi:hypothetical protein